MSVSKNVVQLIGRLGAAPEIKKTENGNTMSKMRVATSESYRNSKGEWVTDTQWHSVTAWGKVAERSQVADKGSEVFIEGKLEHRNYMGNDGQKKFYTDIVALEFAVMQRQPAETTA
jgi:single-strand DNA-binding protein